MSTPTLTEQVKQLEEALKAAERRFLQYNEALNQANKELLSRWQRIEKLAEERNVLQNQLATTRQQRDNYSQIVWNQAQVSASRKPSEPEVRTIRHTVVSDQEKRASVIPITVDALTSLIRQVQGNIRNTERTAFPVDISSHMEMLIAPPMEMSFFPQDMKKPLDITSVRMPHRRIPIEEFGIYGVQIGPFLLVRGDREREMIWKGKA